jgi:hypothetical protein
MQRRKLWTDGRETTEMLPTQGVAQTLMRLQTGGGKRG